MRSSITASLLSVALFLSVAPPAEAGVLQRLSQKQLSRQEFKRMLKINPELKVYRKGVIGTKSALVKTAVAGALVASGGIALAGAIDQGTNGAPMGGKIIAATLLSTGAIVGGAKAVGAIKRSANTRTVEFAMKSGVEISPTTLKSWARDRVINPIDAPAK